MKEQHITKDLHTKLIKGIKSYTEDKELQRDLKRACVLLYHTSIRYTELKNFTAMKVLKAINKKEIKIFIPKTKTKRIVKLSKNGINDLKSLNISEDQKLFKTKYFLKELKCCIRKILGKKFGINSYKFSFVEEIKRKEPDVKVKIQVGHEKLFMSPTYQEQSQILCVIATSKNTPLSVLKMLFKSKDKNILRWLGENHNLPKKLLKKLVKHEDSYVRYGALANPNLQKGLVNKINNRKT